MRSVTTLETVSWAAVPRWVSRPQNIGDAVTQGLELEAKFRLSDLWPTRRALDVRANASFFRSRVKSVPGPDNRLDQQPDQHGQLRRRLPLARPAAHARRQPQLDARLHDAPVATSRPRSSAGSSSSTPTRCGPSARRRAAPVGQQPRAARLPHRQQRRRPDTSVPRDLADDGADLHQPQLRLELKL